VRRLKDIAFKVLCLFSRLHSRITGPKLAIHYVQGIFGRKSEALADLLRKRGFHVEVRSGLSRKLRVQLCSRSDLWISTWNSVPREHLPRNYIFWNAEPINMKRWTEEEDWSDVSRDSESFRFHDSRQLRSQWIQSLTGARAVWGYTRLNADVVARLRVPFSFVPFGYAPYYEATFRRSTGGKSYTQDIDVLFFGWVTDRRKHVLDQLIERGMNVRIVSQHQIIVGDALDELMARSKIILGIHGYDDPDAQIPDLARFDYLLSNRLFAIHESPSEVARDLEFETNVTTCAYADIPDTCAHYLDKPELRASRAEQAYQWFKAAYAMEDFIPFDQVRSFLQQKPAPAA